MQKYNNMYTQYHGARNNIWK